MHAFPAIGTLDLDEGSLAMDVAGTVLVVDDDRPVRDSLAFLLDAAGFRSLTFDSAEAFLAAELPPGPSCLLLDVRMPRMSGLELQRELQQRGSTIPVVFLTAHGDVPMAVTAMQHGAVDFLEKPFDQQDLLTRVKRALELGARRGADGAERDDVRRRLSALTKREREVLRSIVEGKTTKAIATDFGTSFNTVQNQRSSVLKKMGVHSVADLVRIVVESGESL